MPLPGVDGFETLCPMNNDKEALYERLVALGNVRDVMIDGFDYPVITQRGRIAMACFAAVNARMG